MAATDVAWICPRCKQFTVQPARVAAVGHECGAGRRLVELERFDPDKHGNPITDGPGVRIVAA